MDRPDLDKRCGSCARFVRVIETFDENGEVIGGNRLIELSAEYEHEVKPKWSLAVFADGGNAFDESGLDMRTGAGIGARWRSPVGPVRIDVAWPVNDPEHGPRLHISLGPDL